MRKKQVSNMEHNLKTHKILHRNVMPYFVKNINSINICIKCYEFQVYFSAEI